MRDENCIFCRIIGGEIPSNTIYEDDDYKVILDNGPATKGHALILPKEHYRNFYDIPEELATGALKLAKKLMVRMTDVLKADGFHILQNNNEAADQSVFHYHMHLVPRYRGDQGLLSYKPLPVTKEELAALKEELTER
ncbi:MAG: HIT family protein [Lachnospiraceae bacterium]|nr:HIT family protein [Lachnospiraceae bacterium]